MNRDLRIVFCVRIESRIESAVRFDFESNFRIESALIYQRIFNPFHRYLFCICHEREWCTQLSTCYSFQFSPKTPQTIPLYDYLTPKLDFKRKFNHRQSFLYKGRLTVRTIRKFRIGWSLRIESRIGSSIRNRISKLRRSLTNKLKIQAGPKKLEHSQKVYTPVYDVEKQIKKNIWYKET